MGNAEVILGPNFPVVAWTFSGVRGQVPGQLLRCNPPGRDRCLAGLDRKMGLVGNLGHVCAEYRMEYRTGLTCALQVVQLAWK